MKLIIGHFATRSRENFAIRGFKQLRMNRIKINQIIKIFQRRWNPSVKITQSAGIRSTCSWLIFRGYMCDTKRASKIAMDWKKGKSSIFDKWYVCVLSSSHYHLWQRLWIAVHFGSSSCQQQFLRWTNFHCCTILCPVRYFQLGIIMSLYEGKNTDIGPNNIIPSTTANLEIIFFVEDI